MTHFGVSPTLIRALLVHGEEPVRAHDRSSLRVIGSTGEPWNPDPWRWAFDVVGGGRLPIVNYSGGTEVAGGIVGCSLLRPIRATSFNGPCVGMAADVVDPAGRSVRGEVGELAIRAPWPGMTRGFWAEPDDERYLDTYWRRRARQLWIHGDWAATRRRRLLVHPRALGRHPQGRRQAGRSGRGRGRARSPTRRSRRPPRSGSPTS